MAEFKIEITSTQQIDFDDVADDLDTDDMVQELRERGITVLHGESEDARIFKRVDEDEWHELMRELLKAALVDRDIAHLAILLDRLRDRVSA